MEWEFTHPLSSLNPTDAPGVSERTVNAEDKHVVGTPSQVPDNDTTVIINEFEGIEGMEAILTESSREVLHVKKGVTQRAELWKNYKTDRTIDRLPDESGFIKSFKAFLDCGCGLTSVIEVYSNGRVSGEKTVSCPRCASMVHICLSLRA